MIRTYRELISLPTFEQRYEYLRIGGTVGYDTLGFDRWLGQALYHSKEWKLVRVDVLRRDADYDGPCDLAFPGRVIFSRPIVHHIEPITADDIREGRDGVFSLDNLIAVEFNTHNAIHYGDASLLIQLPMERRPGDTKLW